ncbi:MAG: single-stranded-DNA-specific exonuclease RecJ [Chloroflexi bacterium]|nr:single-stranded-DNA-specific exonuclease RecJ [Chloroflexota bacterium]
MMLDPIWEQPPKRVPEALLAAFPEVPSLVVHVAAYRWRRGRTILDNLAEHNTRTEIRQREQRYPWPTPEQLDRFLFRTLDYPLPLSKTPHMREAAWRLKLAVERQEPVGVHGDYDADGITATAILTSFLTQIGVSVTPTLPHRLRDGYGITVRALEDLHREGIRLVIAVDCGITAHNEAKRAAELGIELIVLDHHEPGNELPLAPFIIDPKVTRHDPSDLPLSAAGLAYRFCCVLVDEGMGSQVIADELLDLVAIGTVADVVPIIGLNRVLVARGLARLRRSPRPGITALCAVAERDVQFLTERDIGYAIAPRLNAPGRLNAPEPAFEILLTRDLERAGALAEELQARNSERQELTEVALRHAQAQIGPVADEERILLAVIEQADPGVIGLVAGKLKERYHRPTIVFTKVDHVFVGSGRSIEGFNMARAIRAVRALLVKGGGHALAGGLTVNASQLSELLTRLQQLSAEWLTIADLRERLLSDASVRLTTLIPDVVRSLDLIGPFGAGNEEVLLLTQGLTITRIRQIGQQGEHLELRFRHNGTERRGIFWSRDPSTLPAPGSRVDVLFKAQVNEYQGTQTGEMNVSAIRLSASGPA